MSTADLLNRGCRRRRENAVVPVCRFTDEARFATPTLRCLRPGALPKHCRIHLLKQKGTMNTNPNPPRAPLPEPLNQGVAQAMNSHRQPGRVSRHCQHGADGPATIVTAAQILQAMGMLKSYLALGRW